MTTPSYSERMPAWATETHGVPSLRALVRGVEQVLIEGRLELALSMLLDAAGIAMQIGDPTQADCRTERFRLEVID